MAKINEAELIEVFFILIERWRDYLISFLEEENYTGDQLSERT